MIGMLVVLMMKMVKMFPGAVVLVMMTMVMKVRAIQKDFHSRAGGGLCDRKGTI